MFDLIRMEPTFHQKNFLQKSSFIFQRNEIENYATAFFWEPIFFVGFSRLVS